jgi:intracellular septation protein A
MIQRIKAHLGYYTVFLLMAVLGFYLLLANASSEQGRMTIVVLLAFFYVVWGLLHHYVHHDISTKIVLEYVLVGALGISVIFFLLK